MFFKLPVILRLDALVSLMSLFRKSQPDETCLQTRLKTANLKQDDGDNEPEQWRETEDWFYESFHINLTSKGCGRAGVG
jgi:hypothetical protein